LIIDLIRPEDTLGALDLKSKHFDVIQVGELGFKCSFTVKIDSETTRKIGSKSPSSKIS
jgi:hypothetical protein